jgi:GrpB-like predicted nucleotidyltransferase (UPF0157 family)
VHLAGRRLLDPLRAHIAHAEAATAAAEPVHLAPHDPGWPSAFRAERDAIAGALGHRALAIEHIGSTAVPGLDAKPIIDVLVGLDDLGGSDEVLDRLEAIGYSWWRDDPSPDRRFLLRSADGVRRFHVHVVARGSEAWRRHLAFRDLLRGDADHAARYAALKRDLAGTHRADREAYTAAKAEFVERALTGGF